MAFISLIFMFIPPLIRDLLKLKYDSNYNAKHKNHNLSYIFIFKFNQYIYYINN